MTDSAFILIAQDPPLVDLEPVVLELEALVGTVTLPSPVRRSDVGLQLTSHPCSHSYTGGNKEAGPGKGKDKGGKGKGKNEAPPPPPPAAAAAADGAAPPPPPPPGNETAPALVCPRTSLFHFSYRARCIALTVLDRHIFSSPSSSSSRLSLIHI